MPTRRNRNKHTLPELITLIGLSVLIHAVLLASLHPIWDQLTYIEPRIGKTMPVTLLIEQPEIPPVEEPEEEEKDPEVIIAEEKRKWSLIHLVVLSSVCAHHQN